MQSQTSTTDRYRVARPCRFVILMAAALLSACGGQPEGLLQPVPPVVNSASVSLLAATSRRPEDNDAIMFGGERGGAVSFRAINVSIPAQREIGSFSGPAHRHRTQAANSRSRQRKTSPVMHCANGSMHIAGNHGAYSFTCMASTLPSARRCFDSRS